MASRSYGAVIVFAFAALAQSAGRSTAAADDSPSGSGSTQEQHATVHTTPPTLPSGLPSVSFSPARLGAIKVAVEGHYFNTSVDDVRRRGRGASTADEVKQAAAALLTGLQSRIGLYAPRIAVSGTDVEAYRGRQTVYVDAEITECTREALYDREQRKPNQGPYGQWATVAFVDAIVNAPRFSLMSDRFEIVLLNTKKQKLSMTYKGDGSRGLAYLDGTLVNPEGTVIAPVEYVASVDAFFAAARGCR